MLKHDNFTRKKNSCTIKHRYKPHGQPRKQSPQKTQAMELQTKAPLMDTPVGKHLGSNITTQRHTRGRQQVKEFPDNVRSKVTLEKRYEEGRKKRNTQGKIKERGEGEGGREEGGVDE